MVQWSGVQPVCCRHFRLALPQMNLKEPLKKILGIAYKAIKWTLGIVSILIIGSIVISLAYQSIQQARIDIGMPMIEVVEILGEPRLQVEELDMCKNGAWYGDCEGALSSGSVRYLIWKYGVDSYYVVGLNKASKVAFRGAGDT